MKKLLLILLMILSASITINAIEAYAVLSTDGKTLSFYYDNNKSSRTGTKYALNTGTRDPDWGGYSRKTITEKIEKVVFDNSFKNAKPTSTSYWFSYMSNLTTINNLSYLNTSEVTFMRGMFYACSKLTTIDLHNFKTSKVTDMYCTFTDCSSLTSLDPSSFNTSNVTTMFAMFRGCSLLTSLDLSNFNTSNVTNTSDMFRRCNNLKTLNISSFNTSKVTNMGNMFNECSSLTTLDINHFDTSKVTYMSHMFYTCSSLKNLDLSNFNTSNVTQMAYMFWKCTNLESVNVSSFNTSKVEKEGMEGFFNACENLTEIDVSNFNTSKMSTVKYMFYGCKKLKKLKISSTFKNLDQYSCYGVGTYSSPCLMIAPSSFNFGVDTSGNCFQWKNGYFTFNQKEAYAVLSSDGQTLTFYCDNKKSSRSGSIYELTTGRPSWFNLQNVVKKVIFDPSFSDARPTTTYMWFDCMGQLSTIEGLQYLNTSNVTEMNYMFSGCKSLTNVDVSHFNTSKVKFMNDMFANCSSLTSLDLSNFDTSNVTLMSQMFQNCTNLTYLNVSNFNTSKVTSMWLMFSDCNSLTTLDVSNFNTCNVTEMYGMFRGCSNLTYLDLLNFNTSNVKTMCTMFYDCNNIDNIDVSHFDTRNVTDMNGMFVRCKKLSHIDVSNFNTSKTTDLGWLFLDCNSLEKVDVSHFDTSNAKTMDYMFHNCKELTSIDVSHFNTSQVTNMRSMFSGCEKLANLSVSNFDTSKVTDMYYMFYNCNNLESLDVSNFNISNVEKMDYLFGYCKKLSKLSVSSSMENIISNSCFGVGTTSSPCLIIAPENFNFGMDTSGKYFQWKGGYFTLHQQTHLLGDVNNDGELTLSDPICIFSWLLEQEPPVFVEERADFNEDGRISSSDGVAIILHLLKDENANMAPAKNNTGNKVMGYDSHADGFDIQFGSLSDITAMMMDVTLPDGVSLSSASLDGTHSVTISQVGHNTFRMATYSLDMATIGKGAVLHCKTSGGQPANVDISRIRLVDSQTKEWGATAVNCSPTGIHNLETGTAAASMTNDSHRYDISGRPATSSTRGIVISQGKKYVTPRR